MVFHFIMKNIVIINILLSLIIVFFERRSPQAVWTWLLLLYFIPIVGFILYLIIGQDYHKNKMFKAIAVDSSKVKGMMGEQIKGVMLNPVTLRLLIPKQRV